TLVPLGPRPRMNAAEHQGEGCRPTTPFVHGPTWPDRVPGDRCHQKSGLDDAKRGGDRVLSGR
ncbi:MAG TPA: hypothetical protein VN999_14150, partial [Thermoanaerobaculia bacterium]|nr:hypothetical protein [Thermoanaerobaculia bacterium]